MLRGAFASAIGLLLAGCAATDQFRLDAAANQQEIIRDGIPALISKKKHVVMLRPSSRNVKSNQRPSFTVVVRNGGTQLETLRETDISASMLDGSRRAALRVMRYDELVQEEHTRQTIRAVGVALSAAGKAMSAANAGYSTTTGTVYGSGGTYGTFTSTTYDPYRAQQAQALAQAQTAADISAMEAEGERNLSLLEKQILKDSTVLPGEWYGGSVVLETPPRTRNGASYTIAVSFGGEVHEFSVKQIAQ